MAKSLTETYRDMRLNEMVTSTPAGKPTGRGGTSTSTVAPQAAPSGQAPAGRGGTGGNAPAPVAKPVMPSGPVPKTSNPTPAAAPVHPVGGGGVQRPGLPPAKPAMPNVKTSSAPSSAPIKPAMPNVKTSSGPSSAPAKAVHPVGGGGIQRANQQQVGNAQRFPPARPAAVAAKPAAAVRPGERVPGEKVGTNRQLTAQAMARKGFGKPAGGNYKAAQTPVAPALSPDRNKDLDNPTTSSPMAKAQNRNDLADKAKNSRVGFSTVPKPASGTAQAATPPNAGAGSGATAPAAKPSWSQQVGKAMRDHVAKGGKKGDTIDVGGKKIKVAWKDGKVYGKKKQLAERIKVIHKQKLEELYKKNINANKGTLGALEVRDTGAKKKANQHRNPNHYKITSEDKEEKITKKSVINLDPENNSTIVGY